MPEQLEKVISDLNAIHIVTVHHSKYALSMHPWDEPLKVAESLKKKRPGVSTLVIGEILLLDINQP